MCSKFKYSYLLKCGYLQVSASLQMSKFSLCVYVILLLIFLPSWCHIKKSIATISNLRRQNFPVLHSIMSAICSNLRTESFNACCYLIRWQWHTNQAEYQAKLSCVCRFMLTLLCANNKRQKYVTYKFQ